MEAHDETHRVARDVTDDVDERIALAQLKRDLFGTDSTPTTVGRYTIIEELGHGGCGVVYRARDPELDRQVAIKVIRPSLAFESDDAAQRLIVEARAIAATNHPNVIEIYDVGDMEGSRQGIFIAMELVEGGDLQQWLRSRERTWLEILAVFIDAGRGLAHAHEVGIAHRDFKPSNVLLGRDGRARVVDFGLARSDADGLSAPGEVEASRDDVTAPTRPRAPQTGRSRLTETGFVMGTPAYMAPEQASGQPTFASDQFSFCVSLCEALVGYRPRWCDDTKRELDQEVSALETLQGDLPGPKFIREVLERGLRFYPDERYPSMAALLERLEHGDTRPSRRVYAAATTLAVAGVLAAMYAASPDRAGACGSDEASLAGVWDDDSRTAVRSAMLSTELPYAEQTWAQTRARLDDFHQRWSAQSQRACELSDDGELEPLAFDQRVSCLAQTRDALRGTVALLQDADAALMGTVDGLLSALPSPERCDAPDPLHALPPAPSQHAAAISRARALLLESRQLRGANRFADSEAKIEAAKRELADVRYPPVWVEVTLEEGESAAVMGRSDEALVALDRVLAEADERAQLEALQRASVLAMHIVGFDHRQSDEALRRYRLPAQRYTASNDHARARFLTNLSGVLARQGQFDEAEMTAREGLQLWGSMPDALPSDVADARTSLGLALQQTSAFEDSERELRRVVDDLQQAYGAEHPHLANAYNNLANALDELGKYDEAEHFFRRAIANWQATFGPEHPDVASARNNLATTLEALGRYAEAEAEVRESMALLTKIYGADHPNVAGMRVNLSNVLYRQDRLDDALRELRQAIDDFEAAVGSNDVYAADFRGNLADLLMEKGDFEAAERELRHAIEVKESLWGPEHSSTLLSYHRLASLLLDTGRPDQARALADKAWELCKGTTVPARRRASIAFVLARALWEAETSAQSRERARSLARTAMHEMEGTTEATKVTFLDEVQAWLDARPAPTSAK